MEIILLALVICLILALKPVTTRLSQKEEVYPPAISRRVNRQSSGMTYQFPKLNNQIKEILEINSQEIARQKQSITRVRIETFEYDGKTYLAIEQNGVLIVREDS